MVLVVLRGRDGDHFFLNSPHPQPHSVRLLYIQASEVKIGNIYILFNHESSMSDCEVVPGVEEQRPDVYIPLPVEIMFPATHGGGLCLQDLLLGLMPLKGECQIHFLCLYSVRCSESITLYFCSLHILTMPFLYNFVCLSFWNF